MTPERLPVVVRLHELFPVGRRSTGRRDGWQPGPTNGFTSLPQPLPLRPRPRLQVQPRVLNALKAPLALVDQLVQHPHTRIQVRVSDSVGVKQIELVRLRHLPGELLQRVEELQIRRREFFLLATRVLFGVAELVPLCVPEHGQQFPACWIVE